MGDNPTRPSYFLRPTASRSLPRTPAEKQRKRAGSSSLPSSKQSRTEQDTASTSSAEPRSPTNLAPSKPRGQRGAPGSGSSGAASNWVDRSSPDPSEELPTHDPTPSSSDDNSSRTGPCTSSRRGGRRSTSRSHPVNASERGRASSIPVHLPSGTRAAPSQPSSSRSGQPFSTPLDLSQEELSRITDLLHSRGLSLTMIRDFDTHLQALSRGSDQTVNQIMEGLRCHDEDRQYASLTQFCEFLLMGNEDTLYGVRPSEVVPVLREKVGMEHNFNIMIYACRALCYMLDVLPRSMESVAAAIPDLIGKLKVISCLDVAEQALSALEKLSSKHGRRVLQEEGLSACLQFMEFFSADARRSALTLAANCCSCLLIEDFPQVKAAFAVLSSYITLSDKRCAEQTVLAISRIVDRFCHNETMMLDLITGNFLVEMSNLLSASPSFNSLSMDVLLRTLSQVATASPSLALEILKNGVDRSLCRMLYPDSDCQAPTKPDQIELIPRDPSEVSSIVSVLSELLPSLPAKGVFAVEKLLLPPLVTWQVMRDGNWADLPSLESQAIEAFYQHGMDSIRLPTSGIKVNLKLLVMHSNPDMSIRRNVPVLPTSLSDLCSQSECTTCQDPRAVYLDQHAGARRDLAGRLVPLLYCVYYSSVGPKVKYCCLEALLKVVNSVEPQELLDLLTHVPVSSFIAGMMLSNDSRFVCKALQLASVLLQKLPDAFFPHFQREGVLHHLKMLITDGTANSARQELELKLSQTPQKATTDVTVPCVGSVSRRIVFGSDEPRLISPLSGQQLPSTQQIRGLMPVNRDLDSVFPYTLSDTAESLLATWIKKQAECVYQELYKLMPTEYMDVASNVMKLTEVAKRLCDETEPVLVLDKVKELLDTEKEVSATAFEMIQSGLIYSLLKFLDQSPNREANRTLFVKAFLVTQTDARPPAHYLIRKLHLCLNQLEQFPVIIHESPIGAESSQRGLGVLQYLGSHPIKCTIHRYPDCMDLKTYRDTPVNIAPLTQVGAIERFLRAKVMDAANTEETDEDDWTDDDDDDDDFDDDIEEEDGERPHRSLMLTNLETPRSGHSLEILLGGHVLPYNMTIYQAIRLYSNPKTSDPSLFTQGRSMFWSTVHQLQYRLRQGVDVHRPSSSPKAGSSKSRPSKEDTAPQHDPDATVLNQTNDPSAPVIKLLKVLYQLNMDWGKLLQLTKWNVALPLSDFINSKITAKIQRQLRDHISVLTNSLPHWITDLLKSCPFLVPFEVRKLLLVFSTFSTERAAMKVQEMLGDLQVLDLDNRLNIRTEKDKKTLSRENLFSQSENVLSQCCGKTSFLEVGYDNEEGSGLGPTLEFYTQLSREFQRHDLGMWRGQPPISTAASDGGSVELDSSKYISVPTGLFPTPIKPSKLTKSHPVRTRFKFLGRFVAKALYDFRMVDLPFSETFYSWMIGGVSSLDMYDLRNVDSDIYNSMLSLHQLVQQRNAILDDSSLSKANRQAMISAISMDGVHVEDLGLDFTLVGCPDIELKRNGKEVVTTIHNLDEYLKLTVRYLLVDGVTKQLQAFKEGFDSVFPMESLRLFSSHEMDMLLSGSRYRKWDSRELMVHCKPDHGYTLKSRAMKFLFDILSEYGEDDQRQFLEFVTGYPKLPVGGFAGLRPQLTIVRKTAETNANPDQYLPSVMTCVNYLKLPDYTTQAIMAEQLKTAYRESYRTFHLS